MSEHLHDYEEETAIEEFLEESLTAISEENARSYLGTYGDVIEQRVSACRCLAEKLCGDGYYGPAITVATTAMELIIRFMLLRPLVQGAFLSDEWSEILSSRATRARTSEDRELLPSVLRQWGVDPDSFTLTSGSGLWQSVSEIWPKRDRIVHQGEEGTRDEAMMAIECAAILHETIVHGIASRLGFTLQVTGKWCEIRSDQDGHSHHASFEPGDPFQKKKRRGGS